MLRGVAEELAFRDSSTRGEHGDMRAFDAFMHNKVQLYTRNLSAFAGPLVAAPRRDQLCR